MDLDLRDLAMISGAMQHQLAPIMLAYWQYTGKDPAELDAVHIETSAGHVDVKVDVGSVNAMIEGGEK